MDDFSEIMDLAADLSAAPEVAARFAKKAVEVTARSIKDDWQQGAGQTGLHDYARSTDYDMRYPQGAIVAEIGPNPGRKQGVLGLVEDAPGDVKSNPQHAGRDAVRANEDDFEQGLQIALHDATKAAVEK